jgi:hypothetical protein
MSCLICARNADGANGSITSINDLLILGPAYRKGRMKTAWTEQMFLGRSNIIHCNKCTQARRISENITVWLRHPARQLALPSTTKKSKVRGTAGP